MKTLRIYSLLLALAIAVSCNPEGPDTPASPGKADPAGKVMVNFKVAVPGEAGAATRAMGNTPAIDNIYVAVFGGSGFYNEWVQATIDNVTEANYDGTNSTVYNVSVALTMSDSRLRLHFIANCPERFKTTPPITGISAQDLEEVVMGKVRSQITDTYNDAYWQKVILPNGVKAKMIDVVDQEGNITEDYATDPQGNYIASDATLAQFPNPIPLVRNFARIYLRNLTDDVTIARYGLVFAPAQGAVAPILPEAFPSDADGNFISNLDSYPAGSKIYYESFLRNYQNYPLHSDDPGVPLLTGEPFYYGGYSPDDIVYGSYPSSDPDKDPMFPSFDEMMVWDSGISNSTGLQAPMFVYERGVPTSEHRATRVLIYAHKAGEKDSSNNDLYKYYALDIVDSLNNYIPLLRNQTYTVKLIGIEEGSGDASIESAAGSSSATVSGDPATQYITEISDGSASIAASYTEMLYVTPGTYDVFFRYIPTYAGDNAGVENNGLVTWEVGTKNESTGAFTAVSAADATASVFKVANNQYRIAIDTLSNGDVVRYARYGSGFTSEASIVNSATEIWGKLTYTTVGDSSDHLIDEDGYFNVTRNGAIRITGTYEGHTIFRDVLIKISPRKLMIVECRQKYVQERINETEVVRVYIPKDLPRAVFPLQFKIEAAAQSITPYGDILPVDTGASIIPSKNGPSYLFIKNLTRTDYQALPSARKNNSDWYYFDCTFKTTIAQSASDVYVFNSYFDDAQDHDRFENYTQRLFTSLAFNSTPREENPVEFVFTMDAAHGSNTVWWDPAGNLTASLSTSNKVLPHAVLVTLQGLAPEINEATNRPYTSFSSGASFDNDPNDDIDYYLYNVGSSTDEATADRADATLRLVATGVAGSTCNVGLSTLNITENPYLYAANSASATIKSGTFTPHYTIDLNASGQYGWTSSTVNPDSNTYYSYQSNNAGVSSSMATMSITVYGYTEFTIYIRSYAESSYDYAVVRNIGATALTTISNAYNVSGTKAHTRDNQKSGTTIGNYTAVTFTTSDGLTNDETPHTFYVQFGKDSSINSNDDRAYVLIPKTYEFEQ